MTINPISGTLLSGISPSHDGTTGTGLDFAVRLISSDYGLNSRLMWDQLSGGAASADGINNLIVNAVRATGAANDGEITVSDIYSINYFIRSNSQPGFIALHGDDENGIETGFHQVQNDGSVTRLFGQNAVDTILDGIYHVGFEIINGRFRNEDGNANATVQDVAFWLNSLLAPDLEAGTLASPLVTTTFAGATGTGLDDLVDLISTDAGLQGSISRGDIYN